MSEAISKFALDDHPALTTADGHVISISQIRDRGMIDLRGSLDDNAFVAGVKKALGTDLPSQPRSSKTARGLTILWLSIDQWLVCCDLQNTGKLIDKLDKSLAKVHCQYTNLSDARTVIRLEGDGVREVIMKGAPVDLTTDEFSAGAVRRLRFAEVAGMIHVVSEQPDVIDLYVFRSLAAYAWNWLEQTSRQASHIRVFATQNTPNV